MLPPICCRRPYCHRLVDLTLETFLGIVAAPSVPPELAEHTKRLSELSGMDFCDKVLIDHFQHWH